jgi:UDP-N-acetylmuramoyl-L-alanyl-D-glutamate--2,6-diaminopimelate ligase
MSLRLTNLVTRHVGVDPEITGVTADSRKVKPGFVFAALPGSHVDGAAFAAKAVEAGAVAVIADQDLNLSVPTVICRDPRRGYALAASGAASRRPAWR